MQHFCTIAKFVTISCSHLHAYYWLQIHYVPEAEAQFVIFCSECPSKI